MTTHPNARRLDAFAAGDPDPEAEAHVANCPACTAYVAELRELGERFARAAPPANEFLAALERRPPPAAKVRTLAGRRFLLAAAPALAAAAAIVVLLRAGPSGTPSQPGDAPPRESSGQSQLFPVRFKGALPLAVVRERAGRQERFTAEVGVRPLDGLRLELSVAEPRVVSAGFLGDDGSWLELFAARELPTGAHFSERAARFDDHPTRGWLIAGEPARVEEARRTRSFEHVSVLPVVLEP
jgi:hypothetical protein